MTALCQACSAPLRWARTVTGRAMPLDYKPNPTGNVIIEDDDVAVIMPRGAYVRPGRDRYMPHHATCPNASDFRRRR